MSDRAMLDAAVTECAELRASLIRRAKGHEDAVAIATAFAIEAARIYRELGGERLVAAQFYRLADNATNEMGGPADKAGRT